jgi:hypothetical protein
MGREGEARGERERRGKYRVKSEDTQAAVHKHG